mgnify:CR=1 FL=1
MPTIIFYVSGHGFGHSARIAEVIRCLTERNPDWKIFIRTSAPRWFYREHLSSDFNFHSRQYDTGVIQADSLNLDPLATLVNYQKFIESREELIAGEVDFINREKPSLVVGDIPPVAFEIAARAETPSLAIANFTWDWIYEAYCRDYPSFRGLLETIRSGYRRSDLLLRLPFAGEMSAFTDVEDIPLIARQSSLEPGEIKDMLKIPDGKPLVILSFGGFSLGEEYYRKLTRIKDCFWLASERIGFDLPGIINLRRDDLRRRGLGYPDLMKAADIVVTKPGYGILSESIANRTRMLYTSRGEFREYPILVEGVKKYLPSRFISQEKLKNGTLKKEIEELLNDDHGFPSLPLNGAETCAGIIEKKVSGKR